MRGIELSQPSFEQGHKGPFQVALRRAAMQRVLSGETINGLSRPFLSGEVKDLKRRAESVLNPNDPAHILIAQNMLFLPHEIFLRGSGFHVDNWLRDSFVTCLALNEPQIELHLLNNFLNSSKNDGHIPTTRLFASDRRWFFDDESTALALAWRGKIAAMGIPLNDEERIKWQNALNWLQAHNLNGYYVTSKGTEKNWMDTYVFKQDTITYNQGVFVAALIAAKKLGLGIKDEQIGKAINAYQSLTQPSGRLQLSARLPYHDISGLFGNFIAARLFGVNILDPQTVITTVQSQPKYNEYNMHVIADEQGEAVPASEFSHPYSQGDYQRGAEWPVFTVIAQEQIERNGNRYDPLFWEEKLRLMMGCRNAEWMNLDNSGVVKFDPLRTNHAWNAIVYTLAKEVLGVDRYNSMIPQTQTELITEASQMRGSTL